MARAAPEIEPDLVRRSRHGDRGAFAGLIDLYWDRLHRWLYHLSHDPEQAEDSTQEAFLKAFTALPSFREGTSFQAWLFRIGYHHFLNSRRATAKVVRALPEAAAAAESPLESLITREALQQLTRAVGRLPSDFRAAFLLRAEEELSFREVAEVLGIGEETARWRVFKARQKLVDVLKDHLSEAE